jgi:hypothetical protein
MLNAQCIEKDNHRWGVCQQVCAKCGSKDLITVNLCESKLKYFCYKCEKELKNVSVN